MRHEIDDYLDIEIPLIAGKQGIRRFLYLHKIRRYYPSYDAVYMVRYCCQNLKATGIRKLMRMRYRRLLVNRYGVFFNLDENRHIGKGLSLPHPCAIVIGSGVDIGDNCTIYQNVTFGANKRGVAINNEYPTIGDNCVFYAGSVIIGSIKVADGTQVGANSVLKTDTECRSIYAGTPAVRKG